MEQLIRKKISKILNKFLLLRDNNMVTVNKLQIIREELKWKTKV